MSANWDDRRGRLTFEGDDLVSSLCGVLAEIDTRLALGQPDTCRGIARQALHLAKTARPALSARRPVPEIRADIAIVRKSGAYFRHKEAAGARLLGDLEKLVELLAEKPQ